MVRKPIIINGKTVCKHANFTVFGIANFEPPLFKYKQLFLINFYACYLQEKIYWYCMYLCKENLSFSHSICSLFDNGIQRYEKLRESTQKSNLSQIGLAIFTQERDSLNYKVESYNFYLCPQSCGIELICKNIRQLSDYDWTKVLYP